MTRFAATTPQVAAARLVGDVPSAMSCQVGNRVVGDPLLTAQERMEVDDVRIIGLQKRQLLDPAVELAQVRPKALNRAIRRPTDRACA